MQHANYQVKDLVSTWDAKRIQRASMVLFFAHDRIWSGQGRVMFYMDIDMIKAIRLSQQNSRWSLREHREAVHDAQDIVQVMLSPFATVHAWVGHHFGKQDDQQIQLFQRRWCMHLHEQLKKEYLLKTNQIQPQKA